jgi:hypothetical protein
MPEPPPSLTPHPSPYLRALHPPRLEPCPCVFHTSRGWCPLTGLEMQSPAQAKLTRLHACCVRCPVRSLDWFTASKMAERASLTRAHILALRLYSSPVSLTINAKLHAGCLPARPHPYPALVITLVDALQRLAATQASQRQAATQKAKQLAEASRKAKDDPSADDTDKANAVKRAAEAAAAAEGLQLTHLWRGVDGLELEHFGERGGVDVGFMSVSKERAVATNDALTAFGASNDRKALRQAEAEVEAAEEEQGAGAKAEEEEEGAKKAKADPPALLFRVVPTEQVAPADISFVSLFPSEAEWVYPPGVLLEKVAEAKDIIEQPDGDRLECMTVELSPRLRLRKKKAPERHTAPST